MPGEDNIRLVTSTINFELLRKSWNTWKIDAGREYVLDGRNGMYGVDTINYLIYHFRKKSFKWLILKDEDCFLLNSDSLKNLIKFMNKNNIVACGVPDGGMVNHRQFNPFAFNSFFLILDWNAIRNLNPTILKSHQRISRDEFNMQLEPKLTGSYNLASLYEPYYCLFFYLRRKGHRLLNLEATQALEGDHLGTIVKDLTGQPFLLHTWHARSYGKSSSQTTRIDHLIEKFNLHNQCSLPDDIIFLKDSYHPIRKFLRKLNKKIGSFPIIGKGR